MLEIFRDLAIAEVGPDDAETIIREIAKALPTGWKRDKSREREVNKRSVLDRPQFSFAISASQGRPAAHLFLMQRGAALEITNIVPDEMGELGRKRYNEYVDAFRKISEPVATRLGLEVHMTSDRLDLSERLTPRAMQALKVFSDNANMGSLHPFDTERWRRFLIAAHEDKVALDAETLARWLIEEWHWPEDRAHSLAFQFDFSSELLSDYDKGSGG